LEEAEQRSLFEEYQGKGSLSIKDVTEKSKEKKSEISVSTTYKNCFSFFAILITSSFICFIKKHHFISLYIDKMVSIKYNFDYLY
ncbi:hypothetical protein ACTPEM_23105, partial [Clostridioides difficile]